MSQSQPINSSPLYIKEYRRLATTTWAARFSGINSNLCTPRQSCAGTTRCAFEGTLRTMDWCVSWRRDGSDSKHGYAVVGVRCVCMCVCVGGLIVGVGLKVSMRAQSVGRMAGTCNPSSRRIPWVIEVILLRRLMAWLSDAAAHKQPNVD